MTVTRQNSRQLIDITEHSYVFTKPYPEKSSSSEEEITRIAKEIIVTVTFHPRRGTVIQSATSYGRTPRKKRAPSETPKRDRYNDLNAHRRRNKVSSDDSDQAKSPAHESDLLPDANRITPPKPGDSTSETLFLGSGSAYEASISDAAL